MISNKREMEELEWEKVQVAGLLFNFPFNTSLSGYSMLNEAIMLSLSSTTRQVNMTRDIYNKIAKRRKINGNSVEKGIKNAIESVNSSCVSIKDINCPNIIIKNALINGRPKNFIMAICEQVRFSKLKLNA